MLRKLQTTTLFHNFGYEVFEKKYHKCKTQEELINFLLDVKNCAKVQKNARLESIADNLLKYSNEKVIEVLIEEKNNEYFAKVPVDNIILSHPNYYIIIDYLEKSKEDKINALKIARKYDEARNIESTRFIYKIA